MVATSVDIFRGMAPANDPRLLPAEAATYSINCWHYYGKLIPIRKMVSVKAVALSTTRVFRIPESYENADEYDGSYWMEFTNTFTDVVRAPVNDDIYDRYYW